MNCKFANEMNIAGFLMSKGINPDKTVGNSFWYCSPLRREKTPSFKVDRIKNVWYDFGTATGGRLIDLVCKMYNMDVPGALLILSGASIENPPVSFSDKQYLCNCDDPKFEMRKIQPIQNPALIHYLKSRKIKSGLAGRYCKEAYYKTTSSDRSYFSLAFENDRHGHELRNRYFKGSTSPKDITTISGTNHSSVNVFEGFMDFLSALTYFNINRAKGDTIVLNGVGFIDKFIARMANYEKINLYLDNDSAGRDAAIRIQVLRHDAINCSKNIHPRHMDFNEFIMTQSL